MTQVTAASSLYEKIGGQPAIAAMVTRFYERVLADPELAPFFEHVPMDALRHMQFEFFSAALGGPLTYSGRPIAQAHHGRGIGLRHFQRFTRHLFETLGDYPLSEADRNDIIGRINLYADEVTGMPGAF